LEALTTLSFDEMLNKVNKRADFMLNMPFYTSATVLTIPLY